MSKRKDNLANVFEKLQGNKNINEQKEKFKGESIKEVKEKDVVVESKPTQEISKPSQITPISSENNTVVEKIPSNGDNITKGVETSNNTPIENNLPHPEPKSTEDSFTESIINKFTTEKKKQTIEETHTRNTLFIRNDLHKRLAKVTKSKRGLKTLLVNEAIEAVLDIIEDN